MDRPYTIKNYPQGKFMCQRGEITAAEAYNLLRDTIEGADYSFDVMIARANEGMWASPYAAITFVLSPRITQAGRGNYR